MGDIQIAVQLCTAVFLQKSSNVCPVFGGLASFQEIRQVAVTDRAQSGVSTLFHRGNFFVFVPLAGKFKPNGVFIHQ